MGLVISRHKDEDVSFLTGNVEVARLKVLRVTESRVDFVIVAPEAVGILRTEIARQRPEVHLNCDIQSVHTSRPRRGRSFHPPAASVSPTNS
jgi:sRNA-binding carbon storage regulator CsrA